MTDERTESIDPAAPDAEQADAEPAGDDEPERRRPTADHEYAVPPDAPVHECRYCERPFADERLRRLHHGLAHAEQLTEDERTAFRDAYREEYEAIRLFRLKALGALVVLYFGLLMVYALV